MYRQYQIEILKGQFCTIMICTYTFRAGTWVSGTPPWGHDWISIPQFDTATPCLTLTPLPSFLWNFTVLLDSPVPHRELIALQCLLTKNFLRLDTLMGTLLYLLHMENRFCECMWACACVCEAFSTNCLAVGWTKERMLCILFGLCRIFTEALQGTFCSSKFPGAGRGEKHSWCLHICHSCLSGQLILYGIRKFCMEVLYWAKLFTISKNVQWKEIGRRKTIALRVAFVYMDFRMN